MDVGDCCDDFWVYMHYKPEDGEKMEVDLKIDQEIQ